MTWRAAVGIHAMSRSTSKEEEKRGEENIPDPYRRLRDVCSANSMSSRKREREAIPDAVRRRGTALSFFQRF